MRRHRFFLLPVFLLLSFSSHAGTRLNENFLSGLQNVRQQITRSLQRARGTAGSSVLPLNVLEMRLPRSTVGETVNQMHRFSQNSSAIGRMLVDDFFTPTIELIVKRNPGFLDYPFEEFIHFEGTGFRRSLRSVLRTKGMRMGFSGVITLDERLAASEFREILGQGALIHDRGFRLQAHGDLNHMMQQVAYQSATRGSYVDVQRMMASSEDVFLNVWQRYADNLDALSLTKSPNVVTFSLPKVGFASPENLGEILAKHLPLLDFE